MDGLRLLLHRFFNGGDNRRLLLPPPVDDAVLKVNPGEDNLEADLSRILRVQVSACHYDGSVVAGFRSGRGLTKTISIHRDDRALRPFPFLQGGIDKIVPGLFGIAMRGVYDFTLYIPAYPVDLTIFYDRLRRNQEICPELAEFYGSLRLWLTYSGVARELWVIGPAYGVAPDAEVGGYVPRFDEAGKVLYSLIHGRPLFSGSVFPGPNGSSNHLRFAFPHSHLVFRDDHIRLGRDLVAFWAYGQLEQDVLSQLLELKVDILLRLQFVPNTSILYVTTCLRSVSRSLDDFDKLDQAISSFSNFSRVTGPDLQEVWESFTLGRDLPNKFGLHSLPGWSKVKIDDDPDSRDGPLATIANRIQSIGDGDCEDGIILGFSGKAPFEVRRGLRPTILYTGPSKTGGKSTTAAYHALQMGPHLIWVDLTPSPLDGVRRWAKKLDGRLLLLDLPDVEFSSDKDSLQYRQDEQNVESFLKELTDQWELNGHISGLPLAILPKQFSLRYLKWVDAFFKELRELMKSWHARTGEKVVLVVDNFSSLTYQPKEHTFLADSPFELARGVGQGLAWFVNNGANQGVMTSVVTHQPSDFEPLVGPLERAFSLHVACLSASHLANVFAPSGEKLATLNMHLPPYVLGHIERLRPGESV